MEQIENEFLKVVINSQGGGLSSLYNKVSHKELLYQVDPRSWALQDFCIFPYIGLLKDESYSVDGKTYSMQRHGLAKYSKFGVEKISADSLRLCFSSSAESKKQYPYDFQLEERFTLESKQLKIDYVVYNTGSKTMYFGLGSHPGFKVDATETKDGVNTDGNFIVFDKEIDLDYIVLDSSATYVVEKARYGKVQKIEVGKALFQAHPTLVLNAKGIKTVDLLKRNGEKLHFSYPSGINYLTLWSTPKFGDYVAIEPWLSLPDELEPKKELSQKRGILKLAAGKKKTLSYTVSIE